MTIRILTISCFLTGTYLLASVGPPAMGEELPVPAAVRGATEAAAGKRSVQIDIRLVELPRGKMRELGFDLDTISANGEVHAGHAGVDSLVRGEPYDPGQINGLLEALRENELARILAEPKLVTLDGRPATIEINAEVAMEHRFGKPAKKKMTGLRVDVLPKRIAANRCRVELRLQWSGIARDKQGVARLRKHRLDTAFTTESGKTMVVSTTTAPDNQSQDDHTLVVLVTPKILDAPGSSHRTASQSTERR